jgi:hypothetical protein
MRRLPRHLFTLCSAASLLQRAAVGAKVLGREIKLHRRLAHRIGGASRFGQSRQAPWG